MNIEIRGLEELLARMRAYPDKLKMSMEATMRAAMLALWENVPPYPSPPSDSTYRRTGTLGRTLGSGMSGGKMGAPDVYQVRELGSGYEGRFGTNLGYAPYVIGDETQSRHMTHWWKIRTVAERAKPKIEQVFNTLAAKLAAFLEGK